MHCEELGGRRASAPGARWSAVTCDALEHGEAQDWHVTLPAWAIAEASRKLTDNDVVAVLGAGIVMMVKWEIGECQLHGGKCQDTLEVGAVRRDHR